MKPLFTRVLIGAGVTLAVWTGQNVVQATGGPTSHLVRLGETLSGISQSYGVPLYDLVELNDIQQPDRIVAGQRLRLPESRPGAAAADRVHVVQPGETAIEIARRYGINMESLTRANALTDPDRLRASQRLRIPVAPSATQANQTLQQKIQRAIAATGVSNDRVGVAARNLKSGEQLHLRSQEVFHAASVMKLPITVEVHRQLATSKQEPTPELKRLTESAIVASDNQAANRLLDKVGMDSVNRTMAGLGLRSTRLYNKFSAEGKVAETRFNQTTPDDMLTLLEPLAQERLVNAESSRAMLGLMERTQDNSKLRRHLPREVRIAHKSGWFEGVSNDVGVVFASRGAYLIAIMAEGSFDYEAGNQLVAAVSKAVYDAWETRLTG